MIQSIVIQSTTCTCNLETTQFTIHSTCMYKQATHCTDHHHHPSAPTHRPSSHPLTHPDHTANHQLTTQSLTHQPNHPFTHPSPSHPSIYLINFFSSTLPPAPFHPRTHPIYVPHPFTHLYLSSRYPLPNIWTTYCMYPPTTLTHPSMYIQLASCSHHSTHPIPQSSSPTLIL